jgi:Mg/Co/Ni transporter MgtE
VSRAGRGAALGFGAVYGYVAGKADWGSAGSETRAAAHVRGDAARARLCDGLQDVRAAIASGWDTCFVLDEDDVVLGRLGRAALDSPDEVPVEAVKTEGPSTIRPSARLANVLERMERQNLANLPVTTAEGRLVGLLLRRDAAVALGR